MAISCLSFFVSYTENLFPILGKMSKEEDDKLRFVPIEGAVDTAFWHVLSKHKLDVFKLKEGPFPINGEATNGTASGLAPRIILDYSSFYIPRYA